jgi:hypothetical protein
MRAEIAPLVGWLYANVIPHASENDLIDYARATIPVGQTWAVSIQLVAITISIRDPRDRHT